MFLTQFSKVVSQEWLDQDQKAKQKQLKSNFSIETLLVQAFNIATKQFHQKFLYGQRLFIIHKGKPKQMTIYLDSTRQKLLWISSKTKAFIIDLYFTTACFQESRETKGEEIKYYFNLKELEEQVVFVFNKQEERNQYFNLFKMYISEVKRLDPKYSLYFSNVTKQILMYSTKNGTLMTSYDDLMKISEKVGLKNKKENEDALNASLAYRNLPASNKKQISVECVDDYFKIQFCNKNLQPIFQQYSKQKLGNINQNLKSIFKKIMSQEQFVNFLRESQKQNQQRIKEILTSYSQQLSFFDFCTYLYDSDINNASRMEKTPLTYPLNNYFCYSSHNTYLSGNQLTSDCKVERYSEDLQNGVKCVQLDIHNQGQIPIVTHAIKGKGLCKPILFEDVIKIIQIYSQKCQIQKKPHYPIILSLENHASEQNKQAMLDIMTKYLGKKLHQLDNAQNVFHTLEYLMGKVIIKTSSDEKQLRDIKKRMVSKKVTSEIGLEDYRVREFGFEKRVEDEKFKIQSLRKKHENFQKFKKQMQNNKYRFNSQLEKIQQIFIPISSMAKISVLFKAKDEINLENIQNNCFTPFQCTSYTNQKVLKVDPAVIVEYTKGSWLRTYPVNLQFDSDNYDPASMLNVGAQIIALNTQTKDDYAWMMYGYFCGGNINYFSQVGYVLKPQRLRNPQYFKKQHPKKHNIKVEVIESSGEKVSIRFLGLKEDNDLNSTRNKKMGENISEFQLLNPDQSFLIFEIGSKFRQCIAIRWIKQGYRIIEAKNKNNYIDSGKRVLIKITRQ